MATCQQRHIDLTEVARATMRLRFRPMRHIVAAALRTRAGQVFAAVNLGADVGRAAVCAEGVALGMAAAAGDTDVESIVAVDRDGLVVAPCGACREMLADYAPECEVIVPGDAEAQVVSIAELIPHKYHRRSQPGA